MRIGIDIGGTFTDFVFFDEETGTLLTHKTLSTPDDPALAVLEGQATLPVNPPLYVIHGSTVATNALLERKGAETAVITTAGFKDILAIGRQNRCKLYDFGADRPQPLIPDRLRMEVDERVNHKGDVLKPLNTAGLTTLIESLHQQKVESVAICLLFSFLYPEHERQIAQLLSRAGFFVSLSSEVLPEFREYERMVTTTINAYISPILDRYLTRLNRELKACDFRIMQSNGGSIRAETARKQGVHSILSGPAGGVVGAERLARLAGFSKIITFDMGGTSTDVSLCDGGIRITKEAKIDGLPIGIPVIDLHTVGAGGGSIAYIDAGGALRVGPQSAGADPGPVCYGKGSAEPTVTDANLVLGRLAHDHFLGGRMTLDRQAAHQALTELGQKADLPIRGGLDLPQTAAKGVIAVANVHMERALRVISVERGHNPQDFLLVSFGGAGGLHACELARLLGIKQVLIPKGSSTLSAYGMLSADVIKDYVQTVMLPGNTDIEELKKRLTPIETCLREEVQAEGVAPSQIRIFEELDVRYVGQSYELTVPLTADFTDHFHAIHQQTYDHNDPGAPLEIVNLRLRVVGTVAQPHLSRQGMRDGNPSAAFMDRRPVVLEGGVPEIPFYLGDALYPGHQVSGPAVIVQKDTTVFLERGDRLLVDEYSHFIIDVALPGNVRG